MRNLLINSARQLTLKGLKVCYKLYYFLLKVKRKIRYKLYTKHIKCDVRELFFQQNDCHFNRYDIIVRYMAIENYYNENDDGFNIYEKMQSARINADWVNESVSNFKNLITSYGTNGYDESSEIELDKNLKLIDGSHRIAMALYSKSYHISCKVRPDSRCVFYGIDWFIENGFSKVQIDRIISKYNEIRYRIIQPLVLTLWAPVQNYFDEITELLRTEYKIISYSDFYFDDCGYASMVRGIYAIDDIEKWKIEKKIEMMQSSSTKKIRMIELEIDNFKFRLKQSNAHTLSTEGEKIKRVYRNAYKNRIENYFYDTILHTGDNFMQNEHISKLFKLNIDMNDVLNCISNYKYVITKIDTKDFPKRFSLNKGMHIVCKQADYEDIKQSIIKFVSKYADLTIRIVPKTDNSGTRFGSLIRLYLNNWLIIQFSIAVQIEYADISFVSILVDNRKLENNFYILPFEYELMVRLLEIYKHPQIEQHRDYINRHNNFVNNDLCNKYLKFDWKRVLDNDRLIYMENRQFIAINPYITEEFVGRIFQLKEILIKNNIDINDICIVGSSILELTGIRLANDIDFIATSPYRIRFGNELKKFSENIEMVTVNWAKSKGGVLVTDDELINNKKYHFKWQGIKFANLDLLYERKIWQNREKDIIDIKAIDLYNELNK